MTDCTSMSDQSLVPPVRNRFDRMELAGAFGDLGTLIPFAEARHLSFG
jgi:hypothetical protein